MPGYEILKLLHVVAAIAWLGGGLFHTFATVQVRRSAPALTVEWHEVAESAGGRYYGPAAMMTLAAGVGMVLIDASIGFGDAWIVIGLAGVAISVVTGSVLIARATGAVLEARRGGADESTVARLERRLDLVNAADLTVLLVVVWAMVAKPGL